MMDKKKAKTICFQSTLKMNDDLLKLSIKKGLTKSGLIKLALSTYLDQQKAMDIFEQGEGSIIEKLDKITQELKKAEMESLE